MLGDYRALPGALKTLGDVLFLGLLGLTAVLERLQFQLGHNEPQLWWASNGRDVVNAFALGTVSVALHVIGFSGPVGLVLAASWIILLTALQQWISRRRFAGTLSVAAALSLGLPVLLMPARVHGLILRLLAFLFDGELA